MLLKWNPIKITPILQTVIQTELSLFLLEIGVGLGDGLEPKSWQAK